MSPFPEAGAGVPTPRGDARRQAIVDFILQYKDEHGYPPNLREIAKAVGLASVSSAEYQLDLLRAKGLVSWQPRSPRTYVVKEVHGAPDH